MTITKVQVNNLLLSDDCAIGYEVSTFFASKTFGIMLLRLDDGAWCISKSVRLVAGRLGFYSQSGHTKDFKIVFAASHQALGPTGSAKG